MAESLYSLFTCKYMLKIITATQRLFFFPMSQQYLLYSNLIVCCKTWEGGADLEGPLIFKFFHS